MLADQWLCERIYNSDLSQTRVLQTAEARIHVPAGRPSAPARCVFINVLRHIRYFGRCRTRRKGTQKRIRCRFACRRLLRLPPAPAHHLAFGRTGCSKVGRQRMSGKRGSRISGFRGNKMSGCPASEIRVSCLCSDVYIPFRTAPFFRGIPHVAAFGCS